MSESKATKNSYLVLKLMYLVLKQYSALLINSKSLWHGKCLLSVLAHRASQDGAFTGTWSTDDLCVFFPNLGGGVWTRHTHLPKFLIHCSEAEPCPRAARLLGQHAESGLQQQISLRRPDASDPGWCCGVKIKQTPVPKPKEAKVKLRVWFTLLLTASHHATASHSVPIYKKQTLNQVKTK